MYLFIVYITLFFFFFKQKTAYEMRISDWSSDVCSSDLEQFLAKSIPERLAMAQQARGESQAANQMKSAEIMDVNAQAVEEIGRASCRERVCQYVEISVVAGSLKKKNQYKQRKRETYTKTRSKAD